MKNLFIILGLVFASLTAFADPISQFTIDWNNPKTLNQGDSLLCESARNVVVIEVPGELYKDFTVTNFGAPDCKLVYAKKGTEKSATNSQLFFYGACAGDNDINFNVYQLENPKNVANITVAAGC